MFLIEKPESFNPKISVVGCFVIFDEKMLLLLRQDHKPQGNTWGQPAGKIRPGEKPIVAAARELLEETGIDGGEKLAHFKTAYVSYPDYCFDYHMFMLKLDEEPEIKIDGACHKQFAWMGPAEALATPLIPELDECIKLYSSVFPAER
jgi:8-oxo-dGTP pyrophosphatase MutT (NUDIX family)